MMSFSEFLDSKQTLQEVTLPISPAHTAVINANPNLQRILNYASRDMRLSAPLLASLSASVLQQSILTTRRLKSLSPAQQTTVIAEQIAIVAAISHLLALYMQKENTNDK